MEIPDKLRVIQAAAKAREIVKKVENSEVLMVSQADIYEICKGFADLLDYAVEAIKQEESTKQG